jgi:hypothetical protein
MVRQIQVIKAGVTALRKALAIERTRYADLHRRVVALESRALVAEVADLDDHSPSAVQGAHFEAAAPSTAV